MALRILTELTLECLSLKGGYAGSSESTLVKMPHCWKSHVTAQILTQLLHLLKLFVVHVLFGPGQDKTCL